MVLKDQSTRIQNLKKKNYTRVQECKYTDYNGQKYNRYIIKGI